MHNETIKFYNETIKSSKVKKVEAYDRLVALLADGYAYDDHSVQQSLRILSGAFVPSKPSAKKDILGFIAQSCSKDRTKPTLSSVVSKDGVLMSVDGHRMSIAYTDQYENGWYMPNGVPTEEKGTFPDVESFVPENFYKSCLLSDITFKHLSDDHGVITNDREGINANVTTKLWNDWVNGWEDGAEFLFITDEERMTIKGKVLGVKCVSVLMPLAKPR